MSPKAGPASAARAARSLERRMHNFTNISRPGRRSVLQRRGSRCHSDGPVPSPVPEPHPHAAPGAALRRSAPGTRRSAAPPRSGMPPLLPARRSAVRLLEPRTGKTRAALFPTAALRAREAPAARRAKLRDSQPLQPGRAEPRGRSHGRGALGGPRPTRGNARSGGRAATSGGVPQRSAQPRPGTRGCGTEPRRTSAPRGDGQIPPSAPRKASRHGSERPSRPAALTAWPRRALQGAQSRPGPPQGSALPARAARGPAAPRLLRASSLSGSDRSLCVCSRLAAEVRAPPLSPGAAARTPLRVHGRGARRGRGGGAVEKNTQKKGLKRKKQKTKNHHNHNNSPKATQAAPAGIRRGEKEKYTTATARPQRGAPGRRCSGPASSRRGSHYSNRGPLRAAAPRALRGDCPAPPTPRPPGSAAARRDQSSREPRAAARARPRARARPPRPAPPRRAAPGRGSAPRVRACTWC